MPALLRKHEDTELPGLGTTSTGRTRWRCKRCEARFPRPTICSNS